MCFFDHNVHLWFKAYYFILLLSGIPKKGTWLKKDVFSFLPSVYFYKVLRHPRLVSGCHYKTSILNDDIPK